MINGQYTDWHWICLLPPEYRFRKNNKKKLKEIEDYLSIKDGRNFYDFRVEVETWKIWLKKKQSPINIQTKR